MVEKINKLLVKETKRAFKENEIPVGAVVVKDNKIIASAHNVRQKKCDVTGHAEVKVIIKAAKKQKDWRLDGYELYVTLEPCAMCQKIIEESRIKKVYYMKKAVQKNKPRSVCYEQTEGLAECDKVFESFFKKLR